MSENKKSENRKFIRETSPVLRMGFISMILLVATATVLGVNSEGTLSGRGPGAEFAGMNSGLHSEGVRVIANASSDCVDCDRLGTLAFEFSTLPNSRKLNYQAKLDALLSEKKVLDAGAAAILRLLAQGNKVGDDERLVSVIKFLAETSARDGAHIVLNTVAEKYAPKGDIVLRGIEAHSIAFAKAEKITEMQREQVLDAVAAVISEGQ